MWYYEKQFGEAFWDHLCIVFTSQPLIESKVAVKGKLNKFKQKRALRRYKPSDEEIKQW